jgi:hypothetical protein
MMLHHYTTNGRIRQTITSANMLILQQKRVLRNSASICFPVLNLSPKRWPSRPSAEVYKSRAPSRTGNYFFFTDAPIFVRACLSKPQSLPKLLNVIKLLNETQAWGSIKQPFRYSCKERGILELHLFIFLALQPFWLYFPQPRSGL